MLKVLLTGGIGSGKSTVARILRILNVPVFEADLVGRSVLEREDVRREVLDLFGPRLLVDGSIDRKALARIVFNDQESLSRLNAIIHPAVRKEFEVWSSVQRSPYVVMEAAISGDTDRFDRVVVVSAPTTLRMERVQRRDGVSTAEVEARMAHQPEEEERVAIADHIITNDGTELVTPQVLQLHEELSEWNKVNGASH